MDDRRLLREVLTDPDFTDDIKYRIDLSDDYDGDGLAEFYMSEKYTGPVIISGPQHSPFDYNEPFPEDQIEFVMVAPYDMGDTPTIREGARIIYDSGYSKQKYKTVEQRPFEFDGDHFAWYRLVEDGRGDPKVNPPTQGGATLYGFEGPNLSSNWDVETIQEGTRGTTTIAGFEADTLGSAWSVSSIENEDRMSTLPGVSLATFEAPQLGSQWTMTDLTYHSLSTTNVQVGEQSFAYNDDGATPNDTTSYTHTGVEVGPPSGSSVTLNCYFYRDSDATEGHRFGLKFGVQGGGTYYRAMVFPVNQTGNTLRLSMAEYVNESPSFYSIATADAPLQTWRQLQVEWHDGADTTARLLDLDGTEVASMSATLDNPNLASGNIGLYFNRSSVPRTSYVDRIWRE